MRNSRRYSKATRLPNKGDLVPNMVVLSMNRDAEIASDRLFCVVEKVEREKMSKTDWGVKAIE